MNAEELKQPEATPVPDPAEVERNAAKCQAVASLQKLFFEEVKNGGDPNIAAAAALRRLAEESRPNPESMTSFSQ